MDYIPESDLDCCDLISTKTIITLSFNMLYVFKVRYNEINTNYMYFSHIGEPALWIIIFSINQCDCVLHSYLVYMKLSALMA